MTKSEKATLQIPSSAGVDTLRGSAVAVSSGEKDSESDGSEFKIELRKGHHFHPRQRTVLSESKNTILTTTSIGLPQERSTASLRRFISDSGDKESEPTSKMSEQIDTVASSHTDSPQEAAANETGNTKSENELSSKPKNDLAQSQSMEVFPPLVASSEVGKLDVEQVPERGWSFYWRKPAKSDAALSKQPVPPGKGEPQCPEISGESCEDRGENVSWGFWLRRITSSSSVGNLSGYTVSPASERNADLAPGDDVFQRSRASSLSPKIFKDKSKKSFGPSQVLPTPEVALEPLTNKFRLLSSLPRIRGWPTPRIFRCTPKIFRKVVVIGVHGYFPARVMRALLGEPKGTSVKFANEAAKSIEEWAAAHNIDVSIEKIMLEGEGKINYRVETLYKYLLNYSQMVSNADFIFFAAHSQGSVVAIHILAKLIQDGITNRKQNIGFLAMAGTCLGPMPQMDRTLLVRAISKIEHDSLFELFELQSLDSPLQKAFIEDMSFILHYGVKVTLVGSVDDQLIPLYSALCDHITHPNLYRAVYIDGEDVAPEVVSPLLALTLCHRNNMITDHGVILELSSPLAGAITGKGHSKLYDFHKVYMLGVEVSLGTTSVYGFKPIVDWHFTIPQASPNPFVLPWALRALVEDAKRRSQDDELLNRLYAEYSKWNPTSKAMRELRFRLAAMDKQSRL